MNGNGVHIHMFTASEKLSCPLASPSAVFALPATSSTFIDSLRIGIIASDQEELFLFHFNPSAILTANSTLYNTVITNYESLSLAYAMVTQYGASDVFDKLCTHNAAAFIEHCISQGASAYLNGLGTYDEPTLQAMYVAWLGSTPGTFPDITTMAAAISSTWTASQIATWINANGGCALNYSILSQYYLSSGFVATAAAYTNLKTAILAQYTTAQIITAISTGYSTAGYTWHLMYVASSPGYLIGQLFTADPAACYLTTIRHFWEVIAQVQTTNNYYSLTSYFNHIKTVYGLHVYNALVSKFIYLSNQFKDRFVLSEWHMYGSSRLGIHRPAVMSSPEQFGKTSHQTGRELVQITFNASWSTYEVNYADTSNTVVTTYTQNYEYFSVTRGTKNYELTNHLGNVLAVISDKKLKICSSDTVNFYMPDLLQANDYSAFGAPLPGRTWVAPVLDTTVVLNNDFSTTGLQGWIKTDNATVTNSANKLNITTSGIEEGAYRKLTVEKGKTYHARVYLDRNGATCNFYLIAKYGGSSIALNYITATTPGYHEITFQAPATEIELWVITAAAPSSSITYYVDDVTVVMDNEDGKRYRMGFNGKEHDDEISGEGRNYDYGARIYSADLGRWMSTDPLERKYPSLTPYCFTGNSPIVFNDIDGRDFGVTVNNDNGKGTIILTANIYTTSSTAYNQALNASKELNAIKKTATIDGKQYEVTFNVNVIPPLAKEDRSQAITDPVGNVYAGTTGFFDYTDEKMIGGTTGCGEFIQMNNVHYIVDGAQGSGRDVNYNAGDNIELVCHEFLHTFGLDDKESGPYYSPDGRMAYVASKYNNFDMKAVSNTDIANILKYAIDNDGKENACGAEVSISQPKDCDIKASKGSNIVVEDKKQ